MNLSPIPSDIYPEYMHPETNILIVGQGLAGTLLAFNLLRHGMDVTVIDDGHRTSASMVDIAVINPVSGRRYAKTWQIDLLLQVAIRQYAAIGETLGARYLRDEDILQALPDHRAIDQWLLRSGDPAFSHYVDQQLFTVDRKGLNPQLQCGRILGALRMDINRLLQDAQHFFSSKGILRLGRLDHTQLKISRTSVEYDGELFSHIVFCEGYRNKQNQYFNWLPIIPMKGEYLICYIPELDLHVHLKSKVSIIPLEQKGMFWCGSTYDRDVVDPSPTLEGEAYILGGLSRMVRTRIEVLQHSGAIRATTPDRRPAAGTHPDYPCVHTITGLGTKGASLAPWCAELLASSVVKNTSLPKEIDVRRFWER